MAAVLVPRELFESETMNEKPGSAIVEWEPVAKRLRRALGFVPPTLAEADVEMAGAGESPISDARIQEIVESTVK